MGPVFPKKIENICYPYRIPFWTQSACQTDAKRVAKAWEAVNNARGPSGTLSADSQFVINYMVLQYINKVMPYRSKRRVIMYVCEDNEAVVKICKNMWECCS